MNNRPFLEKASWVAGVASALIAAGVWISPTLNIAGAVGTKAGVSPPPAPRPAASYGAAAAQPPSQIPVGPNDSGNHTRWSCDGVAPDLRQALAAAEGIGLIAQRDQALLDLARKALCIQDYAFFRDVAGKIGYVGSKDEAFGDAVDFALGVRRFDLANEFAAQIAYVGRQDAARARISAAASMR